MHASYFTCSILLFAVAAFAQLNVGDAWQGTWSDGKRSGGGSLYICVDPYTATAHGAYSGIGIFSGFLHANTLTGFWWEAGYDRPFGPFELTLTGTQFTGTWSYFEGEGVAASGSFSWSGSRSSSTKPDRSQCLQPAIGNDASGSYEPGNFLCYSPNAPYLNTEQDTVSAAFPGFGDVIGYTPDNGISFLLSDFYFPNVTDDNRYRPEGSGNSLGPCTGCFDDDGEPPETDIPTRRIVVGRLISNSQFCGYFWEGLYNTQVAAGAICFQRTSAKKPDLLLCGSDVSYINGQIDKFVSDGITSWILSQVQSVFDNIVLPPVKIIPNNLLSSHTSQTYSGSTDSTQQSSSSGSTTSDGGQAGTGSNVSAATSFVVPVVAIISLVFLML